MNSLFLSALLSPEERIMTPEEFAAKLTELQKKFPVEQENAVRKSANKFRKIIMSKSPDSGTVHKLKLNKSWSVRMTGFRATTIQAEIYSKSPHFHLVERGHVIKTRSGKVKGFKQGTFFLKKTVNNNQKEIIDDMGKMFLELIKDKLNG